MPVKRGSVAIKRNPEQIIKLGGNIYAKHLEDGAASPLNAMVDNNWSTTGPKIAACLKNHEKAEKLRKEMEAAYEERDKVISEIEGIVRNSAALLKGIYRNSPKKLGDWGFDVSDTAATKKATVA